MKQHPKYETDLWRFQNFLTDIVGELKSFRGNEDEAFFSVAVRGIKGSQTAIMVIKITNNSLTDILFDQKVFFGEAENENFATTLMSRFKRAFKKIQEAYPELQLTTRHPQVW